jgi:hypothetical protein
LDEVDQQVENLRLDRNDRAARAQLPTLAVEREILKRKQHVVARNIRMSNYIQGSRR